MCDRFLIMLNPSLMNKGLRQYLSVFILIILVTLIGMTLRHWIDYHAIGYLYLLSVMVISATFGRGPIFFSAILSAVSWNFFFMTPKFSFEIGTTQDMLICYTYFIVALLGGYFNTRFRRNEKLLAIKEESERLYQTLLNSISHEIRTPLTVISGNAAVLQQKELLKDPEWVASTANELYQASERLNRVVENLLDMSRIESGHLILKKEVFSACDLVEYSLDRLKPSLSHRQIDWDQSASAILDDLISGDFKLLDHAVGNLILNAARYSPQSSRIQLEVRTEGHKVSIRVSDEGPGIPEEFHQKIFDKFFRVPGTPTGGVGLGLSIVKGIVDAHDAKINIAASGRGTTFELIFEKAVLPEGIRGNL